jgi:hypothetical protein
VRVPAQIAQDLRRAAKGGLGMHHPVLLVQSPQ